MRLLFVCAGFIVSAAMLWSADVKPRRVPWTTSHIHGSPDPPKPFVAQREFPKLQFNEALELVYEPVAKRWFALERLGKILSWPADGDVDHADLVADIKALHPDLDYLYGIAFHPKFSENHQVFITYTRGAGIDDGTKLGRFVMKDGKLDVASEKVILTWRSGGHNGANLQFGPDGMLYISTGDSEVPSPPDPRNTGQDISDLLSSILRIDVDHADAGLAYAIPKDNPFITTPKARGEVWAYGLRNPWKMSFDRATGRLWCGDVGWELWEMIHLIQRGGNYGWSAMEAGQPVKPETKNPLTPISPPIVAHSHDEAASITGGYVYHGKKFPELDGAYIYGDWVTGKIWALWYDGKQVTRHEEIADTHHKIIAFGITESSKGIQPLSAPGGIYYLDYSQQGALYELARNKVEKTEKFPTKLSETGLFKDVAKHVQADGVYLFDVNRQMWNEGMSAWYLVALPGMSKIATSVEVKNTKDALPTVNYRFVWPPGAVLLKTYFDQWINSTSEPKEKWASAPHPIETQMLHFDGVDWHAYSYAWNKSETDADLVSSSGLERTIKLENRSSYSWRHPSRAECMRCHNPWCGGALGFTPMQIQWVWSGGQEAAPDRKAFLDDLTDLGLVDSNFLVSTTGRIHSSFDSNSSDDIARAYLHTNCSHCHRQNAGGAVNMFLNAELLLPQTRTVGVTPQQGGLGLVKPKLIDLGNPWNSVIALRIAKTGVGHMPIIGPHEVDVEGLKLIEDWIARMGDKVTDAAELLPKEWSEPLLKDKLASVDGAMQVLRAVDDGLIHDPLRKKALDLAWSSPLPTVRDLFDRFLSDDKRVPTLGMNPDPKRILALKGDAVRGAQLLNIQGKLAACFACHLINGTGREFGPDLSKVASRLKPEQILESILQPSKIIAQGYQAVSVETRDSAVQVGFIVKESAGDLSVKTATGQTVAIAKANIAKQTKLPASLMPEGLAQSLTPQEAADLVAFLSSLK